MKFKHMALLVIAGLLVLGAGLITVQQTVAQSQENLLVNPGFENGHHHQNDVPELAVPDGWVLHWLDGVAFEGTNGIVAYRPESVVWNIEGSPPHEKDLYWRDGIYTLKIFKSWAPLYAALTQDVNGLQVGRRYRLVAPIYIDIFADYEGGQKIPPQETWTGKVRLGASPVGAAWRDEGAIAYSGWWTAATISPFYLAYPTFIHEFTATQPNMTVWIEIASTYPYPNNGFFMDTLGLYALDEVVNTAPPAQPPAGSQPAQPAGPTATPLPPPTPRADGAIVHVVQSGDTLWSLAIQYAPAMEQTAEQALVTIRELNNDPTFINTGQELMIVPPSANAAAAAATPAEGEAEAAASGEEAAEGEAAEAEATSVVEAEPTAQEVEAEPTAAPTATTTNSVCVLAYNDANGDGVRQDDSEALQADAAFTLLQGSDSVATYISDGINEPYCFEDLDADTYQVQFSPPPEYKTTTSATWAVAVSDGITVPVEFGAQESAETAVTDGTTAGDTALANTGTTNDATAETTEVNAAENAPGGFFSNLGGIVIAVAVVLVLLAGAGVFLLRRG